MYDTWFLSGGSGLISTDGGRFINKFHLICVRGNWVVFAVKALNSSRLVISSRCQNYFLYCAYSWVAIICIFWFAIGGSGLISTDGGRFDVDVSLRQRLPVYWTSEPDAVRRCSWFSKSAKDDLTTPYEEEVAATLEVCLYKFLEKYII